MKKKIGKDGIIFRQEGNTVIQVLGSEGSLKYGAICINTDSPEKERIYQKTFYKKPVYLPTEYDSFVKDHLSLQDNFVLTMNGYSYMSEDHLLRYGIKAGEYEAACEAILKNAIKHLRGKFDGARLQLSYGASDMGIDMAIEKVARYFNIDLLGFSCPAYMMYVKDDEIPVFVANNSDDYADYYIRSADLLITTGGRKQALEHDVLATCIYNKRVHFVDVLNNLSSTGGVPATIKGKDGKVVVDNAAAAFGRNISFFNRDNAIAQMPTNGDRWDAIFNNINSVATEVCRSKMSPARMF
ncbi:MAG: hypothetical protein WCG25_01305 [bacterium]